MSHSTETGISIAMCTCPSDEVGQKIANALVTERLAACVNQISGVQSTYLWQGALHNDAEILLVIKTTTEKLATVAARIKALHPYEVPEFIALPVHGGSESYLQWVRQNVEN
ncbi:MAG TPA: divalent-cation tolerance protein CutA [Steroidobacteraceae bacterium]|nr:divalent-cation tolerance protein CutA [Steroidobacteraceae bacterium]